MITYDQALYQHYLEGEISYDDAILHADSANEVRLMIKLGGEKKGVPNSGLGSVSLVDESDL